MPPFNSSLPYSVYSADPASGGGGNISQNLATTLGFGDDALNQNIVNLQQLIFNNNAANKILDSATDLQIQTAGLLEVIGGDMEVVGTTDTIKVSENTIGVKNGSNPLILYSDNITTAEAITSVDADAKFVSSSTLVSLPPTTTDAPNGTNQDGIYKITLRRGMDLWPGTVPFDRQETFGALQTGFPSSQTVEYENKKPLQFPSIIGRIATNVEIAPATTYKISNFGTQTGAPTFEDRMVYDPLGCRSRLIGGSGWYYAGAPSLGRDARTKYLINVKWYFEGRWNSSDPSNRLDMYVNQYRSGALLRAYQVARSNNADSCFLSGERTFFGNTTSFSEDFDPSTDDFEVEVANMAPSNEVRIGLGQCELRFILAQ